ncbi:MAG: adenylosuccinate synthase, partial [Clostridiales bacterium]|nr:adenylosuccinate synthase [Clostridiales bacterium]
MVRAIVGANWGDEGKGKLTDVLARQSDIVIRFQGGANAGHTIINEHGKFALHLLPSGIFHEGVVNMIGPGVALDIEELFSELDALTQRGVPAPRLLVSDRAQVLMDFHILLDTYEEERLADRKFGSTKSGIAPFYSDKASKIGIQVCQLMDKKLLKERLAHSLVKKNILMEHLYHKPQLDVDALCDKYYELGQKLLPFVCDTTQYLHEALKEGKRILLEGQLGALRDLEHGIYPYTTSSSPLAGYATVGAGIPVDKISEVIAVTKAYSSSVGAGYFVSALSGDEAEELRKRGGDSGEYGAKTGRPRDVGWFDTVATRYGCRVQGATQCAMTNIDVLSYLDEIKICVAYEINGETVNDFPCSPKLAHAKPVYQTFPGWKTDVRGITEYDALPKNCKAYLNFIEKEIETPITIISNGPH